VFRVNDANRFVPREHRLSINKVEGSARCFYCRFLVSSRLCEVDHGQVPPEMRIREWDMRHFGPPDQQLRGFFEVLLITPPYEEFGKLDVLSCGCTLQVGIVSEQAAVIVLCKHWIAFNVRVPQVLKCCQAL
jgi:hypothetical protein